MRKADLALPFPSQSRNMFSLLAQSLGNGPYSNAVVKDSPDHNGTVATIALRAPFRLFLVRHR